MARGERLMFTLKVKGGRRERAGQLQALIAEVRQRKDKLKLTWVREQLNP